MAGKTFQDVRVETQPRCPDARAKQHTSCMESDFALQRPLTDPLLQDLDHTSQKYLLYFASHVCQDFVLYDTAQHNPFCELIPLAHHHSMLLQIIIANSALRMLNASQRSGVPDPTTLAHPRRIESCSSLKPTTLAMEQFTTYKDALAARQRALVLLNSALSCVSDADIDVILAAVLLFISFELIDSGRDSWKYHINGARAIIERLVGSEMVTKPATSPLRNCLVYNCLIFDIIGSTLACPTDLSSDDSVFDGAQSLLLDAEGNHCSSFPAVLLRLIRAAAKLSQPSCLTAIPSCSPLQQATLLLDAAYSFNPVAWATSLQQYSPFRDLQSRASVASAHRGATCIYLSRVILALDSSAQLPCDLESLVESVVGHLKLIEPTNPLFIATTWPTFIAGAETQNHMTQEWVAGRFGDLWSVEPWGLIKGAWGLVEMIWGKHTSDISSNVQQSATDSERVNRSWLEYLRGANSDWLIL